MRHLFNYSGHFELDRFGIQVCPKIGKTCIQKIIIWNGQIIHNFFIPKNLADFEFIASIIYDNAFWWSIITTIYKNHVLGSTGTGIMEAGFYSYMFLLS